MEKEENYSASSMPPNFTGMDFTIDHHHHHHQQLGLLKPHVGDSTATSAADNNSNDCMVNYLLSNPQLQQQQQQQQNQHIISSGFCGSSTTAANNSLDKLSFADVMQFADFGPKLALNQTSKNIVDEDQTVGIMDPVYSYLKFPVLNDKFEDQSLVVPVQSDHEDQRFKALTSTGEEADGGREDADEARVSGNTTTTTSVQLQFLGEYPHQIIKNPNSEPNKNKRKRPRTVKTTEEVESQRMTHIAVERNRRKQMNEHLRVLRSLMPGSYVQRGDQASIIGGAIEFVRELEQLLQCLESQKRRRILGEAQRQVGDSSANNNIAVVPNPHQQPVFPPLPSANSLPNDQTKFVDFETGLREETAENKSCLADVEVKLLGFDAMIKILSRRRPGQLIKTIAALEDLQFNILHTNITTIEQTVLYSFNVKIGSETRFNAEDIASSVQQIFSFIHANSSI